MKKRAGFSVVRIDFAVCLQNRKRSLDEKLSIMGCSTGDKDIITMLLIFLLDTFFCIDQGVILYGAQMLMNISAARRKNVPPGVRESFHSCSQGKVVVNYH